MMGFKSPEDVEIANDLRSLVIQAITTSVNNTGSNSGNGAYSSAAKHSRKTFAVAAASPSEESDYSTSGSTTQRGHARAPPARTTLARQVDDIRILLTVPTAVRLLNPAPMAIRQAICGATGFQISDIPRATATKTGWALTPASKTIRDQLMEQENREKMIRAVDGDGAALPQKWHNYAVQNVQCAYRSLFGEETPITLKDIEAEVAAQTKVQPISCRPSRHGPNEGGLLTWVISFLKPVRPFQLFGTSDRSKEIIKKVAIVRHEDGCQGYCNPTKCTKAARCAHCGDRIMGHVGPAGAGCAHKERCVNCQGPHRSGHNTCPAVPRRVNGRIIKPTKKELTAIQRAGRRAFQQVHALAEQQAQQLAEQQLSQESSSSGVGVPVTQAVPVDQDSRPATTGTQTMAGRKRTAAQSQTPTRTPINKPTSSRPTRNASYRSSLNLAQLSAQSIVPQNEYIASSQEEDMDIN